MNKLRDALLDAVDARDEAIKKASDIGAALMRHALATVVVEAAKAGATEAQVDAAIASPLVDRALSIALAYAAVTADKHASKHSRLILGAGKGKDEGPIRREHIEARRAARTVAIGRK